MLNYANLCEFILQTSYVDCIDIWMEIIEI